VDASFGCVDVCVDALERVANWVDHLRPQELPAARRTRPALTTSGAMRALHVSTSLAAQGEQAQAAPGPASSFGEGIGAAGEAAGEIDAASKAATLRGPNLLDVFSALVALPDITEAYVILHRRPAHDLHAIAALLRDKLAGAYVRACVLGVRICVLGVRMREE
jgi:hypothetical protein